MDSNNLLKQKVAIEAIKYIKHNMVVGVGTGSTVKFFIEELGKIKHKIDCAVSSSEASTKQLKSLGIQVVDLNYPNEVDIYIDGADEINPHKCLIKGGGGALTREKIIATCAKKFICIADNTKNVKLLGEFPLPVEVIPMARGYVAREIVKLGGQPVYREDFITDNGNIIIDIYNLQIINPKDLESKLNQITGTVCNGIFAHRTADIVITADENGINIS